MQQEAVKSMIYMFLPRAIRNFSFRCKCKQAKMNVTHQTVTNEMKHTYLEN